ncbi:MAG: hypothetical protein JHD16_00125 [Solirubrobacteraceae bacterium]|nr:hypothetical protein [Solirubrobacteraceae bacterium]
MTATTDTDYRDAYAQVCKRFAIDPKDTGTTAGEDAGHILSGEDPCERYCVVTRNGDITYAYAQDTTLEEAFARAVCNIDNSIHAETPIAVIDLHTGEEWAPNWRAMPWEPRSKAAA